MVLNLEPVLEKRLQNIARQRQCSLHELLTDFADNIEQTQFPGNPFKLIDQSPALIAVSNRTGEILYVNDAFCGALGYTRETLLTAFTSFIHPDDLTTTLSIGQRLADGETVTPIENRLRHNNGSYRWFSWTVIPDADYVYSIVLDISEQKNLEAHLRDSFAKNERILSITFDGYLVGDREGNIFEVNERYCSMLGYTRSELLSMRVFDLDVALSTKQITSNTERIIQQNQSLLVETQHRHKDGHLIDIEINSITLDETTIVCFIRDISVRKSLERQLQQSEQYHRGIVESQTEFVCRYTPDTVLTYVNDAYCRHFGKSREGLLGKSFLGLDPEIDRNMIFSRIDEVMKNPAPNVRRFQTLNANGEKRWIEWTDFGIQDKAGNVVEIQAVGHDITDILKTKENLQKREEMLSTIFKNIPVMLAQFDTDGRFEYVNQHWIDVLGWTVEEMRAHPDIMKAFYPETQQREEALNYMLTAESGWHEFSTRTKNGDFIRTSWANVRLSDGRAIGIGVDLSERMNIEERLRTSEEKFRTMLELAAEGILLVDKDGIIRVVNRYIEDVFRVSREDLIGRSVDRLISMEKRHSHERFRSAYMQNPVERPMGADRELQAIRSDGTIFPVEVSLTPIQVEGELHVMAFVVDISERKQLEEQRIYSKQLEVELEKERELIEIKERFVSIVSHEFRTPLAVMQSSTSLIIDYIEKLPQERVIEKLNIVSQQIQRMVAIMEDALHFSKTSAGKTEVHLESVSVMYFIQKTIDTMNLVDDGKHLIVLEGNDGLIDVDVKLFDHILSNLLSNALKYSPDNTTVSVAVAQRSTGWQFKISDEGIGIPEEDVSKLFEPFYRASNAGSRTGTGLGLSIVKEYVALHSGRITVESTLGAGTTFTVDIPKRL